MLVEGTRPKLTPNLREAGGIARAARSVQERWPDVAPDPPESDRDRLLKQLDTRLKLRDWEGCRISEVTSAARAAFDPERRGRLQYRRLRRFLTQETAVSDRPALLGAMAAIYLESFVPGSKHSLRLADALGDARSRLPRRWLRLFSQLDCLLDARAGHRRLADLLLAEKAPYGFLREAGMIAPHAPGFIDYMQDEAVSRLSPSFAEPSQEALNWMLSWIAPKGRRPREAGAERVVAALLSPWRDKAPPEAYRSQVTDQLVEVYGDPRLRGSGIWNAVPEQDRKTIFRWLTGATLDAFLDIVSEAETSHMWEPRREFWQSLFHAGRIDAAWVALSSSAKEIASRHAARSGNAALKEAGLQTAGGTRRATSLLILQISNKIVVEGSHSYKVHIFRQDNPYAPKLYQEQYNCESIRLSLPENHKKTHRSDWRNWVLENL